MNKYKILLAVICIFATGSCSLTKKNKSPSINLTKINIYLPSGNAHEFFTHNLPVSLVKKNVSHLVSAYNDDRPIAFVISAPSGCGKDTAINSLIEKHKELIKIVNVTTRKIRTNEKNDYDYHFVSQKEFDKLEKEDKLAQKAVAYGQKRGILKSEIESALKEGKNIIFNVNKDGYEAIKDFAKEKFRIVSIFILPESKEILLSRLTKRGTEKKEEIDYRMLLLEESMIGFENYDYKIISGTIDETFNLLDSTYQAEEIKKNNKKSEEFGKNIIKSKS